MRNKFFSKAIFCAVFLWFFLFLSSASSVHAADLIQNGGFESGTQGWFLSGAVVSSAAFPHFGTRYAVLGGVNKAIDTLSQTISIPASATSPQLSFWYNISSDDKSATGHDVLLVKITDSNGVATLVDTFSNLARQAGAGSSFYQKKTFTVPSSYIGKTVTLEFFATTDNTLVTTFRIDDVMLVYTQTPPPSTVPIISNAGAGGVTQTTAIISWTTDQPTDSQVIYGQTTSYGLQTALDPTLQLSHSQTLTGLSAETAYHFQVKSKNAAGNQAMSPDAVFFTQSSSAATGTPPTADTWIFNGLAGGYITSLAINPASPSTLYAVNSGIFKSTNGGASWQSINNALDTQYPINVIAVNPLNPAILYVGAYNYVAQRSVYKSTDGGASWNPTGFPYSNVNVLALVLNPANPSILYAGGEFQGVLKSTDGGVSWQYVGGLNDSARSLAVDPLNPSTVYAGTYGSGVFKSTNGGTSWQAINTGLSSSQLVTGITINPVTPATVYIGIYDLGLFKSTNSGSNWQAVNTGLTNTGPIYAINFDPQNPSTIYMGAYNGGVLRSTDSGAHWQAINTGLTNTTIYSLAIDPVNPVIIYAGTRGSGVFKLNSSGSTPSPANHAPTLSFLTSGEYADDGVNRDDITTNTPVSVQVNYSDPDGDPATHVYFTAEGFTDTGNPFKDVEELELIGHAGTIDTFAKTNISIEYPGNYTYYFSASDGKTTVRLSPSTNKSLLILDPNKDYDGDGLLNGWEMQDIDTNGDGVPDLSLSQLIEIDGTINPPSPQQKDIYVWVDWLVGTDGHTHKPPVEALGLVKKAFSDAPIQELNPNHKKGINLHIIFGNAIQETERNIELDYSDEEFNSLKNFSLLSNGTRPGMVKIFHYAVYGHYLPEETATCPSRKFRPLGIGGWANGNKGSDFIIGHQSIVDQKIPFESLAQGGVFMHEFGHTLGLGHGGIGISENPTNRKPNQLSVMNYSFAKGLFFKNPGEVGSTRKILDYSRFNSSDIPDLHEDSLDEHVGLDSKPQSLLDNYGTIYYKDYNDSAGRKVNIVNDPIDWNLNGSIDTNTVSANVNGDFTDTPILFFTCINKHSDLSIQNEWLGLDYMRGNIGQNFAQQAQSADNLLVDLFDPVEEMFSAVDLPVKIDIKPGSDTNPINFKNNNEVIPVAIISTESFDAKSIDVASVRFEGAAEIHKDSEGKPIRHEEDVNGDGKIDLVLHFRLGDTNITSETTDGQLTGRTFSGLVVSGDDAILLLSKE